MKNCFVKVVLTFLFFFVGLVFYTCDMTLEPSEIEFSENPVELKWIKSDYNSDFCWYTTEYKDLFNYGIECNKISLYLNERYFTYSINDTIYLIVMKEYFYYPWYWSEK